MRRLRSWLRKRVPPSSLVKQALLNNTVKLSKRSESRVLSSVTKVVPKKKLRNSRKKDAKKSAVVTRSKKSAKMQATVNRSRTTSLVENFLAASVERKMPTKQAPPGIKATVGTPSLPRQIRMPAVDNRISSPKAIRRGPGRPKSTTVGKRVQLVKVLDEPSTSDVEIVHERHYYRIQRKRKTTYDTSRRFANHKSPFGSNAFMTPVIESNMTKLEMSPPLLRKEMNLDPGDDERSKSVPTTIDSEMTQDDTSQDTPTSNDYASINELLKEAMQMSGSFAAAMSSESQHNSKHLPVSLCHNITCRQLASRVQLLTRERQRLTLIADKLEMEVQSLENRAVENAQRRVQCQNQMEQQSSCRLQEHSQIDSELPPCSSCLDGRLESLHRDYVTRVKSLRKQLEELERR